MKIAFIGYGGMTTALAGNWQGKHELFVSGRDDNKAAEVAARFNAAHGTVSDAVAFAEVVVLAVPASVVEDTVKSLAASAFDGRTVIDISNPVDTESFVSTRPDRSSVTEAVAALLPGAHLGKAFNMAHTSVWEAEDKTFDGRRLTSLYTADGPATDVIARLIEDTASEPVLLGGNAHAYQLEAAAAIVIKFLFSGRDSNTVLNLIQPEVKAVR